MRGVEYEVGAMKQIKLDPGSLLDPKGYLSQSGYATQPVKVYDRKAIKAGALRIKEWDYYLVYNNDFGIALTVADNSYMGLVSATFLDFNDQTEHTVSPMVLLPFGRMDLPSDAGEGDIRFKNKKVEISFLHEEGGRRLLLNMPTFENEFPLIVDVLLSETMEDSMVIATPFKNAPKAFYYNQKVIGMSAHGTVTHKDRQYSFNPKTSFGILDWGRGVWTYNNTWYWSAANGMVNGNIFGFNLGYGFGDTSAASENMLFYNGAHKLGGIHFNIPVKADGSTDYLKPWRFTSSDCRFEADFMPILDRSAYTSYGFLMSDQHQVFGYFDGKAVLDDGEVIEIKHLLGFAEKVQNKW
ncbi:MAG: hypothetical protein K0Q87_1213 [Neobacillus sp.]|jgi:hypothetical protein|nr:hypothetical protein [Neobacillus sp.]